MTPAVPMPAALASAPFFDRLRDITSAAPVLAAFAAALFFDRLERS